MNDINPLVHEMAQRRDATATLKARALALFSSREGIPIFAFEGKSDVPVYRNWLQHSFPELTFAHLVCGSKSTLRKFCNSLVSDSSGLASALFFFVDRDYDDLDGFNNRRNVFHTDRYSIENYCIDPVTVEQILKNYYIIDFNEDVIKYIVSTYARDLGVFCQNARGLNFSLFAYRSRGESYEAPEDIGRLYQIDMGSIEPVEAELAKLPTLDIDDRVLAELEARFSALDPVTRYRGKWFLSFLQIWLARFCAKVPIDERLSPLRDAPPKRSLTETDAFAATRVPEELRAFITSVVVKGA